MTEPSWTMGERQILAGPYAAPEVFAPVSLGVDRSAPWVALDAALGDLTADERSWLGTLLNGLSGSKPRREVTVAVGDGALPREIVATLYGVPAHMVAATGMDSWRRDSVLKERPALNASPALNRDPVEEARLDAEHDARMADVDKLLKGSMLGEVLDPYLDGDVFIAPAFESPSGTIIDGLIRTLP